MALSDKNLNVLSSARSKALAAKQEAELNYENAQHSGYRTQEEEAGHAARLRVMEHSNSLDSTENLVLNAVNKTDLFCAASELKKLSTKIPRLRNRLFRASLTIEAKAQEFFTKQIPISETHTSAFRTKLVAFFQELRATTVRVGDEVIPVASTANSVPLEFLPVNSDDAQRLLREILKNGKIQAFAPIVPVTSPHLDIDRVKKYFTAEYLHGYVLLKKQIVFGMSASHLPASMKIDDPESPQETFQGMLDSLNMKTSGNYTLCGKPQKWKGCYWQWVMKEREMDLLAKSTAAPGHIRITGWSLGFQTH